MFSDTTQSLISLGATISCLIIIQSTSANSSNNSPTSQELHHHHHHPYNILIIIPSSTPSNTSTHYSQTAYQILDDYTFPTGILPKGVTGYDLNSSTGKFSVHFNDTCIFSLQNSRQFKFKSTIKGYISNGKISSLEGVSVRLFIVWMEIVEILWSGDDLVFTAAVVSAAFPVDDFRESPHCGCGFSCGAIN